MRLPLYKPIETHVHFVLTAKAKDSKKFDDPLVGTVAIICETQLWKTHFSCTFADIVNQIGDARRTTDPSYEAIEKNFRALDSRLINDPALRAQAFVHFTLERDGLISFERPVIPDQVTRERSEEHARSQDRDLYLELADQAYFFVRDLSHRHQHHAPTAECILSLQEYPTEDLGWSSKAIFSLYNSVIIAKRGNGSSHNADALGILAYARSLKAIIHARVGQSRFENLLPIFNDETLRESIAAAKDKLHALEQIQQGTLIGSRSLIIGGWALFMAILSAVFALKAQDAKPDLITSCVVGSIVQHFSWLFLIATVAVIVWVLDRRFVFRNIWRLALGLAQSWGFAAIFGSAVFIAIASLFAAAGLDGTSYHEPLSQLLAPFKNVYLCINK